jgi:KaiC/GvpD/RAD55 family RecA-like ATPase
VSAPTERVLEVVHFHAIQPQLDHLWLVDGLLPLSGLALIYGHPGSGKSFLALDLALHVALGQPWLGRHVEQGVAIYVAAEGVIGLKNRIEAFKRFHQVEQAPFAFVPEIVNLQDPEADTRLLTQAILDAAKVYQIRPAIIIIDTLSKTFGSGKENTDDMARYVENCARVAAAADCLVVPVHHRPKDSETSEPRGHGSLKGGMDTVLLIENGPIRKIRVTKQKDGEAGTVTKFRLDPVALGNDARGSPVTSCVVQPVDQSGAGEPDAAPMRLSSVARLALAELDKLAALEGVTPPPEIPVALLSQEAVVIPFNRWRDSAIALIGTSRDISRDSSKRSFNRYLPALESSGAIAVYGDWVWRAR